MHTHQEISIANRVHFHALREAISIAARKLRISKDGDTAPPAAIGSELDPMLRYDVGEIDNRRPARPTGPNCDTDQRSLESLWLRYNC